MCERSYPCVLSAQGPHEKCFYYFPDNEKESTWTKRVNELEAEIRDINKDIAVKTLRVRTINRELLKMCETPLEDRQRV